LGIFFAGVGRSRSSNRHGAFFVLGIVGVDVRGIQLVGGKAGLGGTEKFLDRGLRAAFYFDGARERESGGGALHFADDGMGVVASDQGDLRTEAGELTDGIHVQDQIFVDRQAPALENGGEGVIVRNLRAAYF